MPRKGENIYKRKDGRWEGRFIKARSSEGKAIYGYLYAPSYREIKNKMARTARETDIVKNKQEISPPCNILFYEIAEQWKSTMIPHVKESTSVKYNNLLRSYILPLLGEKTIQSLSHEDIVCFCNTLLLKGGVKENGLSSKTVADCLSLVRSILKYSSNQGILPLCDGKSVSIKQCSKELRILSIKEQDCLYQYLYDNLNERNIGILICLFTGLRIGEICALRWGDISLTEQTLRVRLTMQRIQTSPGTDKKTKILIAAPKSSCSVRTIPLPNELVQILSSYEREENAYVLTGVTEKFVEPRTMQNHFRRITNACGISNVNYHALRHTFATRCVELGFDIKSLSEILGHASVNITMNRYVHPSMETKRKNMMRLSELFPVS